MESPLLEDEVYLCKGCSEPLEEGKAFELAGQRWHLPCFRCSTCGNILDADANLLLLGDGNLICHACTYSCSACGNKIEDLAILTGDQAFCSGCFRCRNCKKKIENLRYARTSQGIFCMGCHETLMARRRKKSRAPGVGGGGGSKGSGSGSASAKEKALPSLPREVPPVTSAFSPDIAELESPPPSSYLAAGGSASASTSASPYVEDARKDGPTLPASTYDRRPQARTPLVSQTSSTSTYTTNNDSGTDHGFLPMTFDPNPAPLPIARKPLSSSASSDHTSPSQPSGDGRPREYLSSLSPGQGYRDLLRDDARADSGTTSSAASTERDLGRSVGSSGSRSGFSPPPQSQPHILHQDKSRLGLVGSSSAGASPYTPQTKMQEEKENTQPRDVQSRGLDQNTNGNGTSAAFKLQEAPRSKKGSLRSTRDRDGKKGRTSLDTNRNDSPKVDQVETPSSTSSPSSINPFDDPKRAWTTAATRPSRNESLAQQSLASRQRSQPATPEPLINSTPTAAVATTTARSGSQSRTGREKHESLGSQPSTFTDAQESLSRDNSVSKPLILESPRTTTTTTTAATDSPEAPTPPSRATARLLNANRNATIAAASAAAATAAAAGPRDEEGDFTASRSMPVPPNASTSTSTLSSSDVVVSAPALASPMASPPISPAYSAHLPKHSIDGAFSMEDELARIMRNEEAHRQSLDQKRDASRMHSRDASNASKTPVPFSGMSVATPAGETPSTPSASASVLRKMSNAVKHGRSFSDRGVGSGGGSGHTPRSPHKHDHSHSGGHHHPQAGGLDISSPLPMHISSPMPHSPLGAGMSRGAGGGGGETNDQLSAQLQRAQARIGELESQIFRVEAAGRLDVDSEILEKRQVLGDLKSGIGTLEAQREILVGELESMADYLSRAKREAGDGAEVSDLQSGILGGFEAGLRSLKASFETQVAELMRKRSLLLEEISDLIQVRDREMLEAEGLRARNEQLEVVNGQILGSLREVYRSNRAGQGQGRGSTDSGNTGARDAGVVAGGGEGAVVASTIPAPVSAPAPNGLGIYHPNTQIDTPNTRTDRSVPMANLMPPVAISAPLGPPHNTVQPPTNELRNLNLVTTTDPHLPNFLQETSIDNATLLPAPKVINISRPGKDGAKKFNWRKGGEMVAGKVSKGINRAFGERERDGGNREGAGSAEGFAIGMPYSAMLSSSQPGSDQGSLLGSRGGGAGLDPLRSGSLGFLSSNAGTGKAGSLKGGREGSSIHLPIDGSVLFGSELTDRCEHEKRLLPSILTRCIHEVETRGLQTEGIYRKSGGSNQVKLIQAGFERDPLGYDISDPDLDIHAVTSTLKQYLRKLPTPLITYDVYDPLLAAGKIADREKMALALRVCVADLPPHHRDCLEFLIRHLCRVREHEARNLMTSLNLAVVFAPTVMRPGSLEREVSDMFAQRTVVQALVEMCEVVFEEG